MKKLGAYINGDTYGSDTILEQNTFVWYEVVKRLTESIGRDVYEVSIWSLKGGYPNGRKPDAKLKTTNTELIKNTVIPIKDVVDKYCIEWEDRTWRICEYTGCYDYNHDYELSKTLHIEHIVSNLHHWSWEGELAMTTLKNATVSRVYGKPKITLNDYAMPSAFDDMIKEELKKSLEQYAMKTALNSCYGTGGFTTNIDPFKTNDFLAKRFNLPAEKETKTMEKKMTETDRFLKSLNDITITSTYSKLKHGFADPYYIYYPEMEITEDIADTLLTVLLMAKRDYNHKVVFNPEKGTTTVYRHDVEPITVKCKDCKFDYILGYEMAKSKMYIGADDYNWFNKIKNHRKTHIQYTEKKPTKKGGKK